MHKKSHKLFSKFQNNNYRGKKNLVTKVYDLKSKEKIKKAGEAITYIVDTVKLCGNQNIRLGAQRDSTKNHTGVGKSSLTIQEILCNYCNIDSGRG